MTLAREYGRLLEMAFETFARLWANQLALRLRIGASAGQVSVAMRSYDEYVTSLPATTALVLCTVEPGRRTALLQFPLDSALTWVDHLLGGPGTPNAVPERELTELEQHLVRELLRRTLADLDYAFTGIAALQPEFRGIQYNPQFVQAAEAPTPVIIARFALLLEGHEVPVSVMVPGEGLIASMRAGQNSEQRTPEELAADAAARARLERAVQEAPVDVRVRFRTVTVRSRDVAALAVGDLLRLRHPAARPLDVVVGDRVLAQAAVGTHGSQLAGLVVHVKEKP
jgi:flagellar motor switch protein FliM